MPAVERFRSGLGFLCLVLCFGCGESQPPPKVASPRLAVFSPGLTGILFDMGLGQHVAGVTNFCILPEGESRPVVGGALGIRTEPILAVKPDMILAQMESHHFAPVLAVRPEIRFEHFEIETLQDIPETAVRLANLLGKPEVGGKVRGGFLERLDKVKLRAKTLSRGCRVMFVVGYERPLVAGKGTFHDEMIAIAGGVNVMTDKLDGWQQPGLEAIVVAAPEMIICQSDPDKAEVAKQYWTALGDGAFAHSVYVVTERDWTIPGIHMADRSAQLCEMMERHLAEDDSTTSGVGP